MKESGKFVYAPPDWATRVQFYLTAPQTCPYIPGKKERKIFAVLAPDQSDKVNQSLSWAGFRRSQNIIYRPACTACSACKSVRIQTENFNWSKRWKRVKKNNADLHTALRDNSATEEQYALLSRYLDARHKNGGMNGMGFEEYSAMIEASSVRSVVIECRDENHTLLAAALTDVLDDGLSVVYSFFDPDQQRRCLGSFMILDALGRAERLDLPYVYLGYWVRGSDKMHYKASFRPLQVYDGRMWRTLTEREISSGPARRHI